MVIELMCVAVPTRFSIQVTNTRHHGSRIHGAVRIRWRLKTPSIGDSRRCHSQDHECSIVYVSGKTVCIFHVLGISPPTQRLGSVKDTLMHSQANIYFWFFLLDSNVAAAWLCHHQNCCHDDHCQSRSRIMASFNAWPFHFS